MRIGLFGGSFDPPHRGHVALARLAASRMGLGRVLFAPVGVQPLKRDRPQASFTDRVAMTRLALAGEKDMELSLIDAPRADGRPNYTIDAVRTLKAGLATGDELFCLMGADSFLSIGKWYRSSDLLVACDFIVASRPRIRPEPSRRCPAAEYLRGVYRCSARRQPGPFSSERWTPRIAVVSAARSRGTSVGQRHPRVAASRRRVAGGTRSRSGCVYPRARAVQRRQ